MQLSGSNSSLHFVGTVTVETVVWVVTVVVLVVHVPHTPGQSDATGNGAFGTLSSQNCKIAGRRQSGPSATPLHPGVVVVVVPVVVVSVTLVEVSVTVVSVAVVAVTVVPVVAVTVVAVVIVVVRVPVTVVPVAVVDVSVLVTEVSVAVVAVVVMHESHRTGHVALAVAPVIGLPHTVDTLLVMTEAAHSGGSGRPLQPGVGATDGAGVGDAVGTSVMQLSHITGQVARTSAPTSSLLSVHSASPKPSQTAGSGKPLQPSVVVVVEEVTVVAVAVVVEAVAVVTVAVVPVPVVLVPVMVVPVTVVAVTVVSVPVTVVAVAVVVVVPVTVVTVAVVEEPVTVVSVSVVCWHDLHSAGHTCDTSIPTTSPGASVVQRLIV